MRFFDLDSFREKNSSVCWPLYSCAALLHTAGKAERHSITAKEHKIEGTDRMQETKGKKECYIDKKLKWSASKALNIIV